MAAIDVAAGWYADPDRRHELRFWDGTAWTRHVADAGVQSEDSLERHSAWRSVRDWSIGAGLVAYGAATWLILIGTSSLRYQPDPFKSPFYWTSWINIAAAGILAGYLSGVQPRPFWWAACLTLPGLVAVALIGTVFYDSSGGVSFWPVGEIFVGIEGACAYVAAIVGASARIRRRQPARNSHSTGRP